MATVVSITEIQNRFIKLSWTNLSAADVVAWLGQNAVPAASLIAYLDAAIASPQGFNDQTITGCSAADATKITNALKAKSVEVV